MYKNIKKHIVSNRAGVYLDEKLRLSLSKLPLLHSYVSTKKIKSKPDGFVFFLYGGIGDIVMIMPLIKNLSLISNVIVFCEKKVLDLSFVLPKEVKFITYEKNTFFSLRGNLRNKIANKDLIFIQTSPVFEMYIVRYLLKISKAVGLLESFNKIRSIGFYMKKYDLQSTSKLLAYDHIFKVIVEKFNYQLPAQKDVTFNYLFKDDSQIIDKSWGKYIIVSAMKSPQWKMGKMQNEEYLKLSNYLYSKYDYTIVFVGDSSEKETVEEIIANSSNRIVNMAGSTSIKELMYLLYCSEFVIANDNGVSHLASFLQLKVLVLFMFSDPKVYKWEYQNYAYLFNKKFDCMPCVGFSKHPKDNYPVICDRFYACNSSFGHKDIIRKVKKLGWVS